MKFVSADEIGEAAASQLHRPGQCLNLGVVGGGDDNEVGDVPLELVHDNVLGVLETFAEGEAWWRNFYDHISDSFVLIWQNILDTTHPPLTSQCILISE